MDTKLLTISYLSSLVANCIVLLGITSLFIWIKENVQTPWIARHRDLFLVCFGLLFILFLFSEAWTNAHMSTIFIGDHWTYLNLEIIALFNLTVINRSEWQLVSTIGITIIWYFANTPTYSLQLITQVAGLVILEIIVFKLQRQLLVHAFLYSTVFVAVAGLALIVTNQIYRQQDLIAWMRQIGALIILEACCAIYGASLLKRAQQERDYEHLAKYDELTNLRNFGAFTTDLEQVYQNFVTHNVHYAIYTMDIDRFKSINDTYGHFAGNEVLTAVAQCLHDLSCNLEGTAHAYRTGGEEFTIIYVSAAQDNHEAQLISQAIQTQIGQLQFQFATDLKIRVSIGEEPVRIGDDNYLDTYKRADKSLYTSKRSGRNAVTINGETIAPTTPHL